MSKLKTMNKKELEYWCNTYKVDYNTTVKDLGDKDIYSTEEVSEYLFEIIKTK